MRYYLSAFLRSRLARAGSLVAASLLVVTCHSDPTAGCVPTKLVITSQPASVGAGSAVSVTVQAQDAANVLQTCFTNNVTISLGTNPGGATLSGTTTVAAVGGIASFTGLTITNAAAGYTLVANASGLTAATTGAFTISAGPATVLTFTTQPASVAAGAAITAVVTARDQYGNTAASFAANVTMTIASNPGGGTLGGTMSVAPSGGVASFTALTINKVGTGYTLTATPSSGAPPAAATSATFNITPGPVAKLAFSVEPSNASAGVAIAPAIRVCGQDANSNQTPAFTGNVTVAIAANPGTGTLSGTATAAAVAGCATFSDLSINKPGAGYTLTATSGTLTAATSSTFTIALGPLTQLVFTQQPSNATAGVAIAPAIVVTAQDAAGNTVTGFNGNVDMSIGTNPGSGTLGGTPTVAAVSGVATFSNLTINKASPGYTLTATAGAVSQGSGAFSIIAGAATQLVFTTQPVNTLAGATMSSVVVTAQDGFNNTALSFGSGVTVAITGGTGTANATLSGTRTRTATSGVASFGDLSIDSVGAGYTLSATAGGLVGAFASASFAITPNVATQLVFTTQPSNRTAGQSIAPSVVVTARDFKGNTATGFTGAVSIAIGNNAGPGGVLTGTTPVNAVAGIATFANLSINKSGIGYTLTAAATGLTGATSAAFTIIAGPATKLVFTVQPVNTAAAPAAITPAVQVSAQDALNNTDLTYTGNVTVAIGTNAGTPTPGALGGTLAGAAVAGVATFNDLTIDKVGNGYTLTANAAPLSGATSAAFNIFANTATHLVFSVQPTNEVAGVSIAPAVQVSALDASNNVVPVFTGGISVAITPLTGDPSAVLSGTTTVNAVAGTATFNLSINKTADGYRLDASAGGVTGVTSATFDITPAAATHLAFAVEPSNAIAGAAVAPAVQVAALDAFDNVDTAYTANIAVAIGTNPGGGTLSGTASVPAVNGVASFATLSINRSGVGYTLLATSGLLAASNSAAFTITHAALNQLVFTAQPVNTVAGAQIAPAVAVSGQDQFGNTVTTFAGAVDMAIGNNAGPGGVLSGTTTQTAVGGVASFGNLSINKAGSGYTLSATTASLGGGFPSAAFDITAGAATVLTYTVQPGNTTAGTSIAAIIVAAQDGLGNTVATFGDDITVAIGTNGGTPTPGTLSGTTTITASSGLATFSNLSINKSGPGYTLSATSPSLVGAFTSAAFNINAGAATQLVFITQPSAATAGPPAVIPSVVVHAQDALFNTDPTFTGSVSVAIGTNGGTPTPGTLTGTTTVANATAGVATFANLSIDKSGTGYTLAASTTAGGVTGVTSTAFVINAGAATNFVITQQPSNAVAGASIFPTVTVEARDDHANRDPTFASLVTMGFVTNAGSPVPGVLASNTATASAGVATFPTLNVNKVGTGYTIQAVAGGGVAASATSSAFTITPGIASSLSFTVNPTNTTANATIAPAIKVTALDANLNVATGFNGNVTVAILNNPAGGTLSGTLTQAAVAGVATFSTLRIDNVGVGYTLSAAAGLPAGAATSAGFNILTSTATQLFFSVQPSNAIAGVDIVPAIVVQARDASGQLATSYDGGANTVTLEILAGTGAPGALINGGTSVTVTAAAGEATFTVIDIDKAASSYKLRATAGIGGVTAATSGFFTITHGTADHLEFAVHPSNATALAQITPQVEVRVVDALGNKVTNFTQSIDLAINTNPSGGTLSPASPSVVPTQGVAAFSNLSIDQPGVGYDLIASTAGGTLTTDVTSNAFDITPAASSRLVFTTQPSTATAGQSITPAVVLTAQDAVGTTLTGFGGAVTVTITAGTGTNGATLSGTATVNASSGVATFNNLSIDKKGTGYRLSATASGLAGATSTTFTINGGAATRLDFTTDPVTTTAGQTITPAVAVSARDNFGNVDVTFTGNVTLAISTNPSNGTLSGTTTVAAVAGVATFNGLSIDKSGTGYRLTASSGALTADISQAFSITGGPVDHLTFTVAPSSAAAGADLSNPNIRVTAFDALGNVAAGFTGDVTLAITGGTGTPGAMLIEVPAGAATATAVSGVAEFVGALSIDKAGTNYTLSATSPGVTGTTSATFNITPAAATKLGFLVQPSNTVANASITPAVQVAAQDAFDNTVTSFAGTVTIVIGTNAGSPPGTLSGTTTNVALVNGVASFANLSINNPGIGYTLSATSNPVLTGTTSTQFSITP